MNLKYPLSLLLFCLSLSFSWAQSGNAVFFSTDGKAFHVALDNKFQNASAGMNIKINDIPEGDYWITVLFEDSNTKGFKSNVRILGGKETSYMLEANGSSWKLNEYSSVPANQVKTVPTGQVVINYNREGVEVKGLKSADKMSSDMVQAKTEINRVQGTRNDPESKRMGKFSGNPEDISEEAAAAQPKPEPETGTTVVSEYIKVENADGTTSIVEEITTSIKEIVERNGQRQLRTKKSKMHKKTNFNCLPMKKDAFIALKESVEKAAADQKLELAQNGVKDQCMTPGQIQAIGDLILSDVDRNNFAIAAKPTCANPDKFPYTITEPVAAVEEAVEEVVEEKVEEVIEAPKPKSKAELKAELKALKQKEKEAKKAAKAKAKAERLAAKKKAKEEKLAAKAAAKKKKEEEKAAKAKK